MSLPLSLHHQGFQAAEGTSALREISLDVIRRVTDLEGATTDSGVYFTTEYGEQLASLEKLLLGGLDVVNRLHNAWIPIHRLPQEILLHIFSLTRSRVPLFYTTLSPIRWPFHLSDTRDLKPLLRVCKYWRRMVLGAPALWSHIKLAQYLQNDRYVKQRCAESPLSILLSLQAFHPNILNTIQSLRVRELHIFGPGTYDGLLDGDSLLDFLKTFSADSLEHCTINVGFAQNTLPVRRLFSGRGENLKSLYLGRVTFLPDNCFPGLTRLVLAGMPTLNENSSGQKWMVSDLVRFLSGSPRLEELGLYRVDLKQLKGTASDSPGPRVASLNRLRYMCFNSLVFEAAVITMQVILSIIRFPPDCHLALMTFNASSFDALLDILPVEKAYNLLRANFSDKRAVELVPSSRRGSVTVYLDPKVPQWENLGNLARTSPFLSNIEEVWLDADYDDKRSATDKPSALRFFTKVKRVVISQSTPTYRPCDMLNKLLDPLRCASPDGPMACPLLETLCINVPAHMPNLIPVRDLLVSRAQHGYRIRKLVVGHDPADQFPMDSTTLQEVAELGKFVDVLVCEEICARDRNWLLEVPLKCRREMFVD